MLRVVLDTNAIDDLADDSGSLVAIEAAVAVGSVKLVTTRYQWAEVRGVT